MKKNLLLLVFSLFIVGCNHDIPIISMIDVIPNLKKYDGKELVIRGYLVIENENRAIYPTKEFADAGLTESAIWVDFKDGIEMKLSDQNVKVSISYFDKKYVVIRGIIDKSEKGHLGAFAGRIDVNSIADLLGK